MHGHDLPDVFMRFFACAHVYKNYSLLVKKIICKSTLFYNAIVQCSMCLVALPICHCSPGDGRGKSLDCGLFLSLFTAIYFAMIVAGEVTNMRECWFGNGTPYELGIFPKCCAMRTIFKLSV